MERRESVAACASALGEIALVRVDSGPLDDGRGGWLTSSSRRHTYAVDADDGDRTGRASWVVGWWEWEVCMRGVKRASPRCGVTLAHDGNI